MGKKEEEKGDESELSLELSIGLRYEKTEDSMEEDKIKGQDNISRSSENGSESLDLQRRREIQAMRRQEVRRKREEKLKKSRGLNHKLFLEAQRLQDREIRERECYSEEGERKKVKTEVVGSDDLSLSLFTENKNSERDCLYPKVQYSGPRNGFAPAPYNYGVVSSWGHNVGGLGEKTVSLEQCSSAVSDYQSMSHKGGSSSDTGSHSSPIGPGHYHGISRNAFDHVESYDSSSQAETDQALGGAAEHRPKLAPVSNPRSKPDSSIDQTNITSSTSQNLSKETSGGLSAASVVHMPCVSATGNGPNGKTITGLLYKYTKTEVSIMCVCHGSSFSPAEFVEHAGGVDISHPLKHITIVPSAFR